MNPQIFRLLLFPLLLLLVVASTGTYWTCVSAGGEEWRPVDPADLALKAAVVEPNADAEAIFWDIRIDDGGENDLVLNHYVRIKIFTERGRDQYSKIDIPYIGGVKIKDVAARTIKPDGSIVEMLKDDIIEKTVVKVSGLKEINMGVTQDQRILIYKRNFFFGGNDSILFPVTTYDHIKRLFDEISRVDNHMITLKQSAATSN